MTLEDAKIQYLWCVISLEMHEKCQFVKHRNGILRKHKKGRNMLNVPSNDNSL